MIIIMVKMRWWRGRRRRENDNEDIELRTQPMLEDKDSENPITNVESNVLNAPEELDKRSTYV